MGHRCPKAKGAGRRRRKMTGLLIFLFLNIGVILEVENEQFVLK